MGTDQIEKQLRAKEAAERLDVSQPYLSLLESGKRNLTNKLAEKAVKVFALPLENLPFEADWEDLAERSAEVLFSALKKENLDSRIAEGLPWLVFTFPEMDWERLIKFAKIFNLQ
ncbi:MAG: helix-turn-helix transcriptional regulator, partial [Pyrinomonadaceae bacterium]